MIERIKHPNRPSLHHPENKRKNTADVTLPIALRAMNWLDSRSPLWVCAGGGFLIVLIGILSYTTGPQLSCSLFYLIPVILVTRACGFRAGLVAALLAASIWLFVDLIGGVPFEYRVTPYWNALMRLGTFVVAVGLVTAMRSLTAHLEDRVKERTAALEAEIAEKHELEKRILEISDTERATFGQDLHDGLCQHLVSAAFSCNLLEEKLTKTAPAQVGDMVKISAMIDDSITQARNLARGFFPVRLESEGLEMALHELASNITRRYEISCPVDCHEGLPTCGRTAGIHLYRIAQEAMVNAAKHSGSGRVTVNLSASPDGVRLMIEDHGNSHQRLDANSDGMGLRIMAYRARLIGATFEAGPAHDCGFRVTCHVNAATYRR